ncbi:MAG: Sir2 family NAD-dependent protein deacetylase [Desulfomonile tiedjei]|nr:Sir2 family NAD-dependent protein deacetylase [Desulfomonile tiedjei]
MDPDKISAVARLIYDSGKIVAFTGAGISTESGIPDFRSPGGIWSRYNQDDLTYQKFRSHEKYRKLYWAYDRERYPAMSSARPNAAHDAIVEIEKSGRLLALVTQNIDGLHQEAGNSPEKIYELHGTVREVTCLDCQARWPREEITEKMDREHTAVPYCPHCGGPLKCATIAFGQSLPAEVLEESFAHARNCDLFLTIGSSLVVQPANLLPLEAKRAGARVVLVNLSPTPYDQFMDHILTGAAGQVMTAVMREFGEIRE